MTILEKLAASRSGLLADLLDAGTGEVGHPVDAADWDNFNNFSDWNKWIPWWDKSDTDPVVPW
ncbi:hypothetical protein AB0K00_14560 [Dactylosporangium sp. NPDC049525]|uniref:hypothetical protein n=1 Tax=Dactylosporangium sp. NPDC049525 TaxID=3154730 RepID=UPI00342BF2CA